MRKDRLRVASIPCGDPCAGEAAGLFIGDGRDAVHFSAEMTLFTTDCCTTNGSQRKLTGNRGAAIAFRRA